VKWSYDNRPRQSKIYNESYARALQDRSYNRELQRQRCKNLQRYW
jgi:hypothetical protein